MFGNKADKSKNDGFSIIEALVILALITGISAITLVSFGGLNRGVALNRAAREMALNFRKTQNMALAKAYVNFGGTFEVPTAVGIRLVWNPASQRNRYIIFGDRDPNGSSPPPRNSKYDAAPNEQIGNTIILEGGIIISSIRVYNGSSLVFPNPPSIHILFVAPEATVEITDNGSPTASSIGDRIEIDLSLPSGQIKTVSVRNSGQISVR